MNERPAREERPRTAASEVNMNDSAGVSPALTYSMLKQATESWRNPSNTWSKSALTTPTPGAKYGRKSKHWSIDLSPSSGAFLPILNIQSQKAELSSRRNQKRNKSASTRSQNINPVSSTSAKFKTTSTATSILDLNSLNSQASTDLSKVTPKLHRESSLPLHLGTISPMLKYANDSQNDFFMSRLALIENVNRAGPSPEPESYDHSLNSVVTRASSRLSSSTPTLATTSSAGEISGAIPNNPSNRNTPNSSTNNSSNSLHLISSSNGGATSIPLSGDSATTINNSTSGTNTVSSEASADAKASISLSKGTHDVLENRWHINIRLPGGDDSNPDEQRTVRADSNDEIKLENNGPKSILKPKLTNENIYDNGPAIPKKQALELSTYVLGPPLRSCLSVPTPPKTGSNRSDQKVRQRRVRLSRSSSIVSQSEEDSEVNNELSSGFVSSPTSMESNLQSSINGSLNGEGPADFQKSVRFCDKPAQVKEYFPWEAPQSSIII